MRAVVSSLALLLALGPIAAAESQSAFTPAAVFAFHNESASDWIAWAPGEEVAESYRVFGLTEDGWTILEEYVPITSGGTEPMSAEVPSGYAAYGVAGVQGAVQSPIVQPANSGQPCNTHVTWDPPGVWHDCDLPTIWRVVGFDIYPGIAGRQPLPVA